MHIYFGGAHNGKRDFVKGLLGEAAHEWIEAGELKALPEPPSGRVVVAGLEEYINDHHTDEEEAVADVLRFLERADRDGLIIILTDMGRGIVPVDPHARWLRDACGRLGQRLSRQADGITRIWYGIPQKIR
ncbi:bifunctional adenosylcobinamide kinase/adenosylcobinamide-phosphate guanylyltransferase [Bhargavaea ullalensis]|uniref:Adenosylcobinamide kinase n=1 Tax=Bhargavaea ullalensis TaxID=1265685 RepID=A0ABV2GBT4_9BACL